MVVKIELKDGRHMELDVETIELPSSGVEMFVNSYDNIVISEPEPVKV